MERIMDAALKGVKRAWNDYYRFSGGVWLWAAPEYYVTANIFNSLGRLGLLVSLEEKLKDIIQCSNSTCPGRYPKELSFGYKSDISIWWADGTLRGIVEVKLLRFGNSTAISKDLERICKLLELKRKNGNSTIQFGLLVAYTDAHDGDFILAKEKIEEQLDNVEKLISERCNEYDLTAKFEKEIKVVPSEDSAWGVIVSLIKD